MDDNQGLSEMNFHAQEISAAQVTALVKNINRTGHGVIPGFIEPKDLERMRAFVAEAVKQSNGQYAGFIGPDSVQGSGLDELASSRPFRRMIEQIYQQYWAEAARTGFLPASSVPHRKGRQTALLRVPLRFLRHHDADPGRDPNDRSDRGFSDAP